MATAVSVIIGAIISSVTLSKVVGWSALASASWLWMSWLALFFVLTTCIRCVLNKPEQETKQTRQFKTFKFQERIVEEPIGGDMVELKTVLESVEEFSEEAAPCRIYNMKGGRIA